MNNNHIDQYLNAAVSFALEGGKILNKYWGAVSSIEQKEVSWNLVTEADKESEDVIIGLIQKSFPSHHILSEETGMHGADQSEFTWIVDPLDGTTNYTHEYPMVAVSIALAYRNIPYVGVVYNPILEELFQAAKGKGAALNGKPIHVSHVNSLERSLLATGFAYDRRETQDNNYPEFCYMTHSCQGVRRGGSAAIDLAYVAAGRLDGYWERGLKPWDIAAGIILIHEAGGKATSYEGGDIILESGRLAASNGIIHNDLIDSLHKAKEKIIIL